MKNDRVTPIGKLEGVAPKWQLAYFGPRIGYYGHIFWDMDFKKPLKWPYLKTQFFQSVHHQKPNLAFIFFNEMGFWDMAILVVFWTFFGAKIANSSPIDF